MTQDTQSNPIPQDVADYLIEGNDPYDMVQLLWDMITEEQREAILLEVLSAQGDPSPD